MLAEADMGMTTAAMSSGNQGDETLLVKFYQHPRLDPARTEEEGRQIFRDADFISIMQPGNKDSIIERPATRMDIERFPVHWQRYQNRVNDDEIVEGTLLSEWPGVSRAQVEELRYLNVRTVEQLAGMSDSNAQNIMGVNLMRDRAKKFLSAAKDIAVQTQLDKAMQEIAALRAQLEGKATPVEAPAVTFTPEFTSTLDEDLDAMLVLDDEPEPEAPKKRKRKVS